ncbi:MAG: hypothetical protein HY319_19190 [Armatimonadetes bacterium]|nr:hypothetical protein [Armatimonadota bacterium]
MINTNPAQLSSPRASSSAPSGQRQEGGTSVDRVTFEGPRAGFEPWLGGAPGGGAPSSPGTFPPAGAEPIPDVPVTIEPWLRGELTDDPAVSPKFADKLTRTFGEQAILSLEDDRVHGVGGYFLEGWESVGGGDFIQGVTLGRLGDQWEMTGYGTFELRSGGVRQELSFDPSNGQTRLESSYEEHLYDTTLFREVLSLDRDGVMRREYPPVGL